MLDNWIVAITY